MRDTLVCTPYERAGRDTVIGPIDAGIGIATYPDDGDDSETRFRRAETAVCQAKKKGKAYSFFSQEDD